MTVLELYHILGNFCLAGRGDNIVWVEADDGQQYTPICHGELKTVSDGIGDDAILLSACDD